MAYKTDICALSRAQLHETEQTIESINRKIKGTGVSLSIGMNEQCEHTLVLRMEDNVRGSGPKHKDTHGCYSAASIRNMIKENGPEEAASMLEISVSTMYRWIREDLPETVPKKRISSAQIRSEIRENQYMDILRRLSGIPDRDLKIMEDFMDDHTVSEIGNTHRLSSARINQITRHYLELAKQNAELKLK